MRAHTYKHVILYFLYSLVIFDFRYGRTGIYKTHLFGSPSIIICEADTCRRVLLDYETFKIGYPKSTIEVIGFKSFWSSNEKEHKGFKRLVSSLTMGHNTLEMYLPRIEDIVINSLEELSSINRPVEFLQEMKSISFDIIINIIMGSYNKHILTKIENSFSDVFAALYCMPIDLPGFAFHKGLAVNIFILTIFSKY